MVKQKERRVQGQILTLFIVSLTMIAYRFPQFSDLLVYDRQAILGGELWRLLTAPLVHFSASHIFWNVAVFSVAGFTITAAGFRSFWLVCCFASVLPSIIFLLTLPELERYGGLSGLATGAVAYLCLCSAVKARKNRMLWLLILLSMGTKIIVEATIGTPIFVQTGKVPFRVLPSVHVFGYLAALAAIIWSWPKVAPHRTLNDKDLCVRRD
ncbi:rhombosortase [Desulfosarcina sp.]|uniref:rhombosortase n=1 Tax=Desulfosarcina sp. TaxID=2027861 RepID=UPI00356AEEE0